MTQFCVFGDSIAKGVVFDSVKEKYVVAKNSCANLFERTTGFIVKNYARFGSTILKGKEHLLKHKEELPAYSRVVLEFGGNDCDFYWNEIAANPNIPHSPHVGLHEFEKVYGDLIDDVKSSGCCPVLMTIPPLHAPRFFDTISKGLDADVILKWLGGDKYFIYRWQEAYNLAVCRLAVEKQVPLVDIRQAFIEKINYEQYLCQDGMHPSEAGHRLINEVLCSSWDRVSA